MNELQALLSPTTLPCNGSAAADIQTWSLQLTVINTSSAPVDLSQSGLRVEFAVDPGGIGSAGALLLSQYSAGEAASGPPATTLPVDAAPATGTPWTVTATQDAPCAFLALPEPGAGAIATNASVSFVFANVAPDLIPGASAVTVTVLPGSTVTVAESPVVVKTPAALSITSFAATPLLLAPPDNTTKLTWSTVGAGICQLSWTDQFASGDQSTTVVTYNDQAVPNPWTAPLEVTGEAPATAQLFYPTQFTLTAQGVAQIAQQLPVTLDPATFTSSAATVAPYESFILSWSAFDGTAPSLTWQSNGLVALVDAATNQPISQGTPLTELAGSATAQITGATTFSMQLANGNSPVPVQVSVDPVTLTAFQAGPAQMVNAAVGVQQATLSWDSTNASGFALTGDDGTSVNLPYTASSWTVFLPRAAGTQPRPVVYALTAMGFSPSGLLPALSVEATPIEVQLWGLGASATQVVRGQPVTLTWSSTAATGFTVFLNSPSSPIASYLLGDTTVYPLPTPTVSATYGVIAHGYTGGGPEPVLTVAITVLKPPKEKEKDKEKEKEKEGKELIAIEKNPLERPPFHPFDDEAQGTAVSGTQQPFIGSGERVDVAAHLDDPEDRPPG